MGNRVCASKSSWPGYRPFDDTAHRKAIANAWGVPLSRLPDSSGPGFVRIIDELARDNVDVCWTVATNPVAGMPDANHVESALEDTFLIVQDAFRSDTVELADVVLPAATWGESEGTVMNMERRVSRVSAAREPPADVRQDVDIIGAVADRVVSDLFDSTRLDPEALFDEVSALTRGTTADLSGISYERLSEELAVRWPARTRPRGRVPVLRRGRRGRRRRQGRNPRRRGRPMVVPDRLGPSAVLERVSPGRAGADRRGVPPHAHHRPSSGRVQHRGPDSA